MMKNKNKYHIVEWSQQVPHCRMKSTSTTLSNEVNKYHTVEW
jgi:hypothetical protein